jgi:hypothetical protein
VAACDSSPTTHVASRDGAADGTGTGGTNATGGGGAPATGATGTGGVRATGGSAGSGGAAQPGGSLGSGGVTGLGGMTTTGGSTGPGSDAGADLGPRSDSKADSAAGGSGGAGGARADVSAEARPEVSNDLGPDSRLDGGVDTANGVGSDATTRDGAPCPYSGNVTYTLAKNANASADEQAAYPLITTAMDQAVYYYNCYTNISKKLNVTYNSGVQTVDGNINGSIRFGPNTTYMEYTRGMHEISHTVGVGTASNWLSFLPTPDGGSTRVWTGASATAELRAITGVPTDVLEGDTQHFWPYGLNYVTEVKSEADVIDHCRIVMALRKDMGI